MKKFISIITLLTTVLFTTTAFGYNVNQISTYNTNISTAAPIMDFS
ncbi:hypothetical protein [Francisella adeliensis]|nr:hypothetical protein [Francisella adeliensis]MBK2086383.1 hypothetical protein [Francisella adeliensis]MBK2096598.1 hypothetical protein [Francisella adeliensis]